MSEFFKPFTFEPPRAASITNAVFDATAGRRGKMAFFRGLEDVFNVQLDREVGTFTCVVRNPAALYAIAQTGFSCRVVSRYVTVTAGVLYKVVIPESRKGLRITD